MPLNPEEEAQGERIATVYNSAPWAETNRWGLGRNGAGGKGLFIAAIRDFVGFGRGVVRSSSESLATMQTSAAALLDGMTAKIDEHTTLLDRLKAATAAAANGPVFSVNGMGGVVVLPDVPKVLPPIVTLPVAGSTPSLTGGALMLAVDRLTSLYGEAQKTIRFQISTVSTFATTVYDSGVLTQTAVSASLANAQATLTGGTTYYVRAIQTDVKDVSSGWSAPVSFVFPRLPNAPVMSAPANNATGVGSNNQAVTFTAGSYSHPNGTARTKREFQISTVASFATIVTTLNAGNADSATLSVLKGVLAANTQHHVRAVDTDTNGGASAGAATSFTTVSAYEYGKYLLTTSVDPQRFAVFGQDIDTFVNLNTQAVQPNDTPYGITCSPDGTMVVVVDDADPALNVYVRDGDTFSRVQGVNLSAIGVSAAFSPNGQYIAIGASNTLAFFKRNGSTLTFLQQLTSVQHNCIAWRPDSAGLVTGSSTGLKHFVRSGDTFTESGSISSQPNGQINGVALSPDATMLIVATNSAPFLVRYDVSSSSYSNIAAIPGLAASASCVAWAMSGAYFAVGHSADNCVYIYTRSGASVAQLVTGGNVQPPFGLAAVRSLAWSKDGNYLAVGTSNPSTRMRIFKKANDSFVSLGAPATLPGQTVTSMTFLPPAIPGAA